MRNFALSKIGDKLIKQTISVNKKAIHMKITLKNNESTVNSQCLVIVYVTRVTVKH